MATTINDLADGIQTRLATVSGLHAFSEIDEQPHEPAAEVLFDGRSRDDAGGGQVARFTVEVSVTCDDRGWSQGIRKLRQYLEPKGTYSIEAAIDADSTLGGKCDWAVVTAVGGESRTNWGDGYRVAARLTVFVCYDP